MNTFLKKTVCLLLAGLFLASGVSCGSESPAAPAGEEAGETAIRFTDDLGRELQTERPERVATLIGSFADIWCLAGGKDSLVATANDTWTSFDLGLSEDVANLGAIKTPNVELLLASQPDLVLGSCNTEGDLALQDTLEEAGICVAYFDVQTVEDYLRMLEVCTQLTGCPENYEAHGTAVREAVDAAIARSGGSSPTVLCIRATGVSCKVKGSEDNVLGEMLADLGCVNVADSDTSLLEELSMEAILQADPDYIFAVLQGSDSTDAMEMLKSSLTGNPAWEGLTAVREGRFHILENSLYNLKPNGQWGLAYEKLADILFPEEG